MRLKISTIKFLASETYWKHFKSIFSAVAQEKKHPDDLFRCLKYENKTRRHLCVGFYKRPINNREKEARLNLSTYVSDLLSPNEKAQITISRDKGVNMDVLLQSAITTQSEM